MPFPYTFSYVLGYVDPSPINHPEEAKARLMHALKDTTVEDLVEATAASHQSVEEAIWSLRLRRAVDYAEGDQLTGLGTLVGEPRRGANDVDYKLRIKARIRINRSGGCPGDVYGVAGLLIGSNITMAIRDEYPAAFRLILQGGDVANAQLIADMVQEAKGGGVRAQLCASNDTAANTFTLDGAAGQGLDEGIFSDLLE